jgi:hypothetical protein
MNVLFKDDTTCGGVVATCVAVLYVLVLKQCLFIALNIRNTENNCHFSESLYFSYFSMEMIVLYLMALFLPLLVFWLF